MRWLLIITMAIAAMAACRSSTEPVVETTIVDTGDGPEDRITIRDRTGHVWDITHAVKVYGFDPEQFQFGIGPGTIAPVFDPRFVERGEQGYPHPEALDLILGAEFNEDARGYLIDPLARREVINDQFGDAHLTVAY